MVHITSKQMKEPLSRQDHGNNKKTTSLAHHKAGNTACESPRVRKEEEWKMVSEKKAMFYAFSTEQKSVVAHDE